MTDQTNETENPALPADTGDSGSALRLGEYRRSRGEYENAYDWYKKAAERADPDPIVYYYLAYALQNGEGTAVDLSAAFDYYTLAAEKELPQACYNLAYFYQNGLVVEQDFKKSEEYGRRAERSLERLVSRVSVLTAENEKMSQTHAEILRSLDKISLRWENLAKKNAELEVLTETRKNEALSLEKELEAKNAAYSDALQGLEHNASLLREKENDNSALKDAAQSLSIRIAALDGINGELKESNAALRKDAEKFFDLSQRLSGEKQSLENDCESFRKALKRAVVRGRVYKLLFLITLVLAAVLCGYLYYLVR